MPHVPAARRLRPLGSESDSGNTIGRMPIYEFRCAACETRFEALVATGTDRETCRECGVEGAERVMSRPAEAFKLVRAAYGNRRQDERNRELRDATKREFKEKRRSASQASAARAARKAGGSS
jgi:putative FmdB family regulatory protein